MKQASPLFLALALLALAGCQTLDNISESITAPLASSEGDSRAETLLGNDCPAVEIVGDLSMLNEFTTPSSPAASKLVSSAVMTRVENTCSYGGKSVTVDLKLDFDGALGPQARATKNDKPFFSYPFFVAVTDPSGDILAKEVFAASLSYESGQDRQTHHEDLRQIIPVPDRQHGAQYKVLVGFQLSQDQLDYNRALIKQQKAAAEAAAKAAPAPAP